MSNLQPTPIAAARMPQPNAIPTFLIKVPAGFPSPATDYQDEALDLNDYLVRHKDASFFFTVRGHSMSGAGILDGDKVLADKSIDPQHGHIVVASIDGQFTLKRLYRCDGRIELRPENPQYRTICLKEGEELQVWGVVVGLARKMMS